MPKASQRLTANSQKILHPQDFFTTFVQLFPNGMNYEVFISYSRKDSDVAKLICNAFDSAGISYFIDKQGISGGFEFPVVLAEAIIECKVVLFLASKNSYDSKFTNAELTFAFNEKPKNSVLPYIIDGSTMPPALRFVFSSINWRTIESHPIEPTLVDDILKLLGRTRSVATPTITDKAREEAERKAREEAARKAREEAERKAREEAERKAREEAARKAREEAARKARERAERVARMKKYSVGDYYNDGVREGVVFEVSADGRHGKIVSMEQSVKKLEWASDVAEYKRLIGANSETYGAYNMSRVRAISGWRDKYPAFKWCADLGEGWYLPSIEELKMFTLNDAVYDAVNRTLSARGGIKLYNRDECHGWYWSSTENDKQYDGKFCAWHVDMSNGNTFNNYKDSIIRVRAVATFGDDILEDDVRAFVEKERKAREVAERKAREEAERRRRLGIYTVGDYYNDGVREGVVFEVSADGRHGKIVSMKQSTEGLQWATTERKFGLFKSEAGRLIGADSETDGAYNMAKVKAISGWREKYPAFKWCADLGEGWYLPSKEELKTFTLNDVVHDAVNRTLSARGCARLYNGGVLDLYWSSTEDDYKYSSDEVSAWVLVMGEGVFGRFGKKNASYVRAVAVF